jgi:hypothetical protein
MNFAGSPPWRFCTPQLAAGTTIATGPGRVVGFFSNSHNKACAVTPSVSINGSTSAQLTLSSQSVPAASAVAQYTWNFSVSQQILAANDQLNVVFSTPSGRDCDQTNLNYSGTTLRSRLELAKPGFDRPGAPTGLSSQQTGDGIQLDWQAPTSGPAPAFYRIYRDGYNYVNRYDRTGDNATTYTDPDREPGSHTYFVTTVTAGLGESLPTPLPPATFP